MEHSISSDLIRGHIDTIILHTLIDGDKYPQQISDTIEKKSEGVYKINQATLYSSLKRLEGLKFVNSYWQDAENGGRRKFYNLTASGKDFAQNNMSNWSISRTIIDKLIDCEQKPVYKTEYVEKIVQVPVERTIIKEVAVENKSFNEPAVATPTSPPVSIVKEEFVAVKQPENDSSKQDVNFRNVLNSLIQSVSKQDEEIQLTELKPIEKDDVVKQAQPEVKSFNQTIIQNGQHTAKHVGSVDFSDLSLMAAKDGIKLRISSKNSYRSKGNLLINKLNLINSMSLFLVLLIELLAITTFFGDAINVSTGLVFGLIGIFVLPAIIGAVKYKLSPAKSINKNISFDSILTVVIIVFNLVLINFACVLFLSVDLTNKLNLLLYIVIPAILYFDLLFSSIINFTFAKSKLCNIKQAK